MYELGVSVGTGTTVQRIRPKDDPLVPLEGFFLIYLSISLFSYMKSLSVFIFTLANEILYI